MAEKLQGDKIIQKAEHNRYGARLQGGGAKPKVGGWRWPVPQRRQAQEKEKAWAAEERAASLETQSAAPHCTKTLELTSKQSWSK